MAVPDPPFSTPRIMKVLEPSAGQYEVIVRMDPTMASKFPDKPFGTAISAIGLAVKDSDKYPGYTLVSIEPADKGAKDHYWIFQKLDGPEWTTTSNSKDNLTPQKYRGQTVVVKTEQEVAPNTTPTTLAGNLVSSVVTQTPNTGKAVLTEVTETIAENADSLVGQQFAPDGTLLMTTEALVTDGTAAETSVNVAQSTVDPIGNGKSVRQTSTAKKRDTSDATVDGWPKKQKKSKGTDNLTPQKYRGQTVTSVTTEQIALAAANVDDIPDPASPVAPQTIIEHEKVNDYRYEKRTITETIAENLVPLEGEEYGEIVTKSVSEILVPDGTTADAGINVISSTVEPLGNGKSVKQTKTAKGGWPNPINKEVSKEGADMPPPRYRKDLTRTKTTRKIPASAVPSTPSLFGDEVAKTYQKETPDRAEESVVTQSFTLDTSSVDESVERKPFVSIKSTMTPGPAPVIPGTGNGSARLVYENGATKIYENVAEVATAIPGLKGIETNAQQWGALVTTTNYTTSSSAPAGGSLQLIYNDGNVWVYESSTSTPSVAGSSTDVDSKEWGKITWNGNFSTSPSGDRSKQVWSNGSTQVFLNENASLSVSGSSKDVEPREWGYITWNGTYSSASGGTKSRQVYSGPGGSVFLNETPVPSVSGTSVDIDPKEWGSVRWDGNYQSSPSTAAGARSKQVWSMGGQSVYHVETPTVILNSGSFVSAREENTVLTEVQTTSYSTAANSGANTRSRVVFSIGTTHVYENISITRTAKGMRTYASVVQVDLPPVYRGFNQFTVTRNDGQDSFIFLPNVAAGYRGTMACTVEETWSENPGSGQVPTVFRPAPMSFQSPLGGFSVGPCLHGFERVAIGVGSEHPVYSANNYDMSYGATQPADWAGLNIIAHVDTVPYNQGFLTRVYKVQL